MNSRLALRPDLDECALEERYLLAAPGLSASQFMPSSAFSPSFVVPGFSVGSGSSGGGPTTYPGPSFFYILLGASGGNASGIGLTSGARFSVYGLGSVLGLPTVQGAAVGSGANDSGGRGGGGTFSNFSGYGGSFSSGYNFGLSSSNNFGMSSTPLGSVPVHRFDNGTVAATQGARNDPPPQQGPPSPSAGANVQGPVGGDNLLGKNLGSSAPLINGPAHGPTTGP